MELGKQLSKPLKPYHLLKKSLLNMLWEKGKRGNFLLELLTRFELIAPPLYAGARG
jgi:hypothetical protein